MRPEALRGGNRTTMVSVAGRAVLDAWDDGDEAALAEAMADLRSVLPVVEDGYDPGPYIAAQEWVVARTMPENPHSYVLIRNSTDYVEHLRFVDWLRRTGEVEVFNGRRYKGRTINWHRYWVLGVNDTIVNRRKAPGGAASVPISLWE